MNLYETINADMLNAMKAHDKELLSTIRLLKSAIDLYKINNKLEKIDDEVVIEVASKQVKTHKESIIEFEQLSEEQITSVIDEVLNKLGATTKKDMGPVMKELNQVLKGKADFKLVSTIVNQKLN